MLNGEQYLPDFVESSTMTTSTKYDFWGVVYFSGYLGGGLKLERAWMYLGIWSIWVADTNKEGMLMCLGVLGVLRV